MAEKRKQHITPVGVFTFCHLNKPDTKFKEEGEYSVTVAFDKDDAEVAEFIANMEAAYDPAQAEAAEAGWAELSPKNKAALKKKNITEPVITEWFSDELDDEGEPTGRILMRFKTKASFVDNKTGNTVQKMVPFIDGKGVMIPKKKRPLVYSGSTGRVAFSAVASFIPVQGAAFVSLYLNQVQITSLGQGGGGSAFGAVEGSDFDSEDLEEYEGNASRSNGGSDADDGDDDDDEEAPF